MRAKLKRIEIPSRETYKLIRIKNAVAQCGFPEKGRRTILVAGTNGKGSVCAYLTYLLLAARLKVGTFISPHVLHRSERIQINGKPVAERRLRSYEKKYEKILEPLSYFERLTLLAFLIFRDEKVDVQILEVGMGGRLDATNIVEPDISVITRVDWDHEDVLGGSLRLIAKEKAGIMRRDNPVFVSRQNKLVRQTLKKEALRLGAFYVESFQYSLSGFQKLFQTVFRERGSHQYDNLRLAFAAFDYLKRQWKLRIARKQMVAAVEKRPLYRARLEVIRKNPFVLVDGAHNLNAVEALRAYLFQAKVPRHSLHLVFGAMDDKPAKEMLRALKPWVKSISFPEFYPERQIPPAKLLAMEPTASLPSNLGTHMKRLWQGRDPVLIAGSFYLAGAALSVLDRLRK